MLKDIDKIKYIFDQLPQYQYRDDIVGMIISAFTKN